jgi:catecholate siderophore receptor
LRLDRYRIQASGPAAAGGPNPAPAYANSRSDTLFNYQLGLVYKPVENGSLYVSIGTSSRPGGSALGNGNEDLAIHTGATVGLEPETTRSIEAGAKWDFLNRRLGVNAALFRNEVANARIAENGVIYMGGNKTVNGAELGFSGNLTSSISLSGGYTLMHSEQKDAGSDANGPVAATGMPFPNTPRHSASLWVNYKPGASWAMGLGLYAQSSVNQGYVRSTIDGGIVTKAVPGYARLDAMMSYSFTRNIALQLNGYNLTNKVYYSGVRSAHYATMGAGRLVTATMKFNY